MPPEQIPYWIGAFMIGVLGYFGRFHFERLNLELKEKADKSEIVELRKELRD